MEDVLAGLNSWETAKPPVQANPAEDLLGGLGKWEDPRPDKVKAQDPKMEQAREWAANTLGSEKQLFGVGVRDILEKSIPIGSTVWNFKEAQNYKSAKEAYDKGEATDAQIGEMAKYDLRREREKSMSLGRSTVQSAMGLPALIGETYLTGGVAGAATKAASPLGTVASTIAGKAAQGAAIPSLVLPAAQQRAIEQGGEWYSPQNLAPAVGVSAVKNIILGTIGGQVGKIGGNLPTKAIAAAAIGTVENQASDVALTAIDKFLPEAYQTHTNWGTIGHMLRGEQGEVWKSLAADAVAFGALGAAHGLPSDSITAKFKEAVNSYRELPPAEAAKAMTEASQVPLEQMKPGPVKEYFTMLEEQKQFQAKVEKPAETAQTPETVPQPRQAIPPAKPALADPFAEYVPTGPKRPLELPPPSERMVDQRSDLSDSPTLGKVSKKEQARIDREEGLRKAKELEQSRQEGFKADPRFNPDLDEMFAQPAKNEPITAPAKELRPNTDLEEFFGRSESPKTAIAESSPKTAELANKPEIGPGSKESAGQTPENQTPEHVNERNAIAEAANAGFSPEVIAEVTRRGEAEGLQAREAENAQTGTSQADSRPAGDESVSPGTGNGPEPGIAGGEKPAANRETGGRRVVGDPTTIVVQGTKPVPAQYEVREMDSIRASHEITPSGGFRDRSKSGEYPEGLQPRDYSGNIGEQEKVRSRAREMETRHFLSDDPNATGGPPSVTVNGTALNGNGRKMMLEEARRIGTYDKYKADLIKKAASYGIDPKAIEGMQHPVLVRVVNMDPNSGIATEFARRGNVSPTQGQSPVRTAASLSGMVDNDVIKSLRLEGDTTFAEAVTDPRNGAAFRDKLRRELPVGEVPKYFNQEGMLTEGGKELVRDMLMSKILPVETIEAMAENMKAEKRTIEGAIPQLLLLGRNNINPTPALAEAIGVLSRNSKIRTIQDAENVLSQKSLFSEKAEPISPEGRMMLDFIVKDGQKPLVFRRKLGDMITDIEHGTRGLFATEAVSPAEAAARTLGVEERPGAKFGGKETPKEPAKSVDEMAEQMMKDMQASRTLEQGPGTAAKANFNTSGPTAKEAGRTFVETVKDIYNSLSGATAPQINRASEVSADKIARHANARSFTNEYSPVTIDKILSKPENQNIEFRKRAGAVLTEMRLRYMRKAFLEQAANAKEQSVRDYWTEEAKKVKSIVGQPVDGDVLRNPLATEADYQRHSIDPEILEVLDRWKEHLVPFMEEQYRKAEGLDPADGIPAFTQMPGLPMNLMRWKPGSGGEGVVSIGGGEPSPAIAGLNRAKLHKLGFARRATGAGEGYHIDIADLVDHSIHGSYELATKADMIRTLVDQGLAKFGLPGNRGKGNGFEYEIPNVTPPKGTQAAGEGQNSLFFKDKGHANEVYRALGIGDKAPTVPLSGFFNLMTLRSLGEVTAHTSNLLTGMLQPGMRVTDLYKNARGIVRNDPQVRDRLVELAKIGALKPKGFESQQEGETLAGKVDPLKWSGKFLDVVDRAVRLTAEQAFKRKTSIPGVVNTEGSLRDFINQMGNYNSKTQNWLVSKARETGLGPFATAGTTFYMKGLRSLFGGHGFNTNSAKADLRLRAEMLGRTASILSIIPLVNYLKWGRVDGDDNTPIGAIKVGTDAKGKTQYFDLASLTGVTRGMRETGVKAMLEGQRPGAKKAGANMGSNIDKGFDDALKSVIHPFAGPAVGTAYTAATGKDLMGRQVAATPSTATTEAGKARAAAIGKPAGDESQAKYNMIAAAIHINPVIASLIELGAFKGIGIADPAHKETTGFKEGMKQLGRYGIKSSAMPPGAPHKTITVPVR